MPQPDSPTEPIRSEFAQDPDMADLINMFVEEMPSRIQSIADCYREQRLAELQTIAHQLKGSGAGYGFEPVSLTAAQLEASLKTHSDIESIRDEVDALIDVCRRLAP